MSGTAKDNDPPPSKKLKTTKDARAAAIAELEAEDDDDSIPMYKPMKKGKRTGAECPYLDTIHRTNLDFDFEKLCSVLLCLNHPASLPPCLPACLP